MYSDPINFLKLGSAQPPIIFLHGWGRSIESFRPLAELMTATNQVYVLDLPGFGKSPLPKEAGLEGSGWDTEQYAERIKSFLAEQGILKCILVGHSFGGRVCLRLSKKYPELVQKLILIGSHGLQRKRGFVGGLRFRAIKYSGKFLKKVDSFFGSTFFKDIFAPRFGSKDYNASGNLKKTLVKTVNEDQSGDCKNIVVPTLLIWGDKDTETTLDIAERLHKYIKGSKLILLPGKGHDPFEGIGAHLVATHMKDFLHGVI